MSITLLLMAVMVILFFVCLFLHAVGLTVGLRWAKAEDSKFKRALYVTAILSFVQLFVAGAFLWYSSVARPGEGIVLVEILLGLAIVIWIVKKCFRLSSLRALQSLVPVFVISVAAAAAIEFPFKRFIGEAFVVPTNSMAPTIMGEHFPGQCEQCGEVALIASVPSGRPDQVPHSQICVNFHSQEVQRPPGRPVQGDRIFSVRFLGPKRWDLVTFYKPDDPATIFVKRLVGLPGETIHVEDGSVFADGIRLEPPAPIENVFYSTASGGMLALHATKDNPAVLLDDEYFMLGDNTERALDSRHWRHGSVGRKAFAVPKSYIHGVVTTTYWPPGRWRTFK